MALGARAEAVLAMMLKRGFGLVGLGASLGLGAAFASVQVLDSLLFGVSAYDPIAFGGALALLLALAGIATLVPARRVTRVDPLTALREE